MSAVLFWKKRIYLILTGILSTIIVSLFVLYAYLLVGIQSVDLNKRFYFLVSENTHIEASTHLIEQNGGAGYLLREKEREYIVLSVYLKEADGQSVLSKVSATEKNVRILERSVEKLYFKTQKDKKNADLYTGAFRSLYGCLEVLNVEIERLSKGATQESSKRIIEVVAKQVQYIATETEKYFPAFSMVCKNIARKLFVLTEDILYVKDLRYLQCEICSKYLELGTEFSL